MTGLELQRNVHVTDDPRSQGRCEYVYCNQQYTYLQPQERQNHEGSTPAASNNSNVAQTIGNASQQTQWQIHMISYQRQT